MRNITMLIMAVFIFPVTLIFGQSMIVEQSNSEKYISKPGLLLEKQYIEIGNIDAVELRLMKIRDLNNDQVINAIRFEYLFENQLQFQTKLAIIDADEIDPLINAIKLMLTKEFITKKTEYTEVSFRSRSGFVTGAYFSPDKKNWEPFIQLNYLDSKSTVFVKVDDLKDLQDKLQKAKEQF